MTIRALAAWTALGLLCGPGGAARAQTSGFDARIGGLGLLSHRSARFEGTVGTGSGTLAGLEVSLRHRYVGLAGHTFGGDFAADSGLAAAGAIRSTAVRLQLGPRIIAAEIGYGSRAFTGSFATRRWNFFRLGARSMVPIGATGLTAEVGLATYGRLGGTAERTASGREVDTRLVYTPARFPAYVAIGYRVERFTVRDLSDTRPEQVSDFLLVVGARIRR